MEGVETAQRSVWWAESCGSQYPALTGPLDVDVAIVGGGITGITGAYLLSGQGRRVAVLEKDKIGAAGTGLTTAFLVETIDTEPKEAGETPSSSSRSPMTAVASASHWRSIAS
jgi:glycine/D-amino acid oxidase-like deaminating enzyme